MICLTKAGNPTHEYLPAGDKLCQRRQTEEGRGMLDIIDVPTWLYAVAVIGSLCCISLERRHLVTVEARVAGNRLP